jgi:D-sedoheptulose 7-phosphate isomerase
MNFSAIIQGHLDGHLSAAEKLRAQSGFIEELARRIIAALESGRKLLFFGNGGSAADAQHLAAEFVVRYRRNRRALPAIALSTDTSVLTAGANDFGVESIFARQIEALANEGDIAIGISTSGRSPNVIAALQAAKEKRCLTIVFTGSVPGRCSELADLTFHAPSEITAHIQECHITVGHILCELVESHFIGG